MLPSMQSCLQIQHACITICNGHQILAHDPITSSRSPPTKQKLRLWTGSPRPLAYVYHVDFQLNSTSNSVNLPCTPILFVAQRTGFTQNYSHIDSTAAISALAWVRRVFQVNSFLSQNGYVKVENQRKIWIWIVSFFKKTSKIKFKKSLF